MKWKNHAKRTATTTSAILLAVMITACSNNLNPSSPSIPTEETEQLQQENLPDEVLPDDNILVDPIIPKDDPSSTEHNATNTPDTSAQVIKAKGIYVGASDNHTIEIEVGQDVLPLQIESKFNYIIEQFPSDVPVEFEYTVKEIKDENIVQYWLTGIKKSSN